MYTPVREDGVHGLPISVTSDTILPGPCFFTKLLLIPLAGEALSWL